LKCAGDIVQENRLQEFKLPEPALGLGGVLLVELRGRAQQQGLYYYIRFVSLLLSLSHGFKLQAESAIAAAMLLMR
jgi:hypothetical protein